MWGRVGGKAEKGRERETERSKRELWETEGETERAKRVGKGQNNKVGREEGERERGLVEGLVDPKGDLGKGIWIWVLEFVWISGGANF